jgi:hypothetical protein
MWIAVDYTSGTRCPLHCRENAGPQCVRRVLPLADLRRFRRSFPVKVVLSDLCFLLSWSTKIILPVKSFPPSPTTGVQ